MSVLGYAQTGVLFTDRVGTRLSHVPARLMDGLSWNRVTSEVSQVDMSVGDPPELLRNLEPWLHHVLVYRQEELVWRGVVYDTEVTASRVSLVARDPSVYFDKRRIRMQHTWFQRDLSDVAAELVRDAFGEDDPFQIATRMVVAPTGVFITRSVAANERLLAAELRDLVEAGLRWTVLGGRLLIGPVTKDRVTAPVTDRDVEGEFAVRKEGGDTVTDALVMGKGVMGSWFDYGSPLGVLQSVDKQDAIVDDWAATNAAKRIVKAQSITPRRISLPSSTRLLPTAPVSVPELVPGVQVPVQTVVTGLDLNARMQLSELTVKLSAGQEEVSVSLVDVPEEPDVQELLPPPSGYDTEDDNPTYGGK